MKLQSASGRASTRLALSAGRPTGQAGMTLVEIMLGLSISMMVMLPLSAWGVAVLRSQPISADSMMKTIRAGFVSAYVPDDVASATAADDMSGQDPPAGEEWWSNWSRSDCKGGPGSNGRKLIVLLSSNGPLTGASSTSTASTTTVAGSMDIGQRKVVYSIAKSSEDPSKFSVWRRTCNAADKSPTIESKELYEGIEPSISKSKAACSSPVGELPCRQMRLILTPKGSNSPVVLNVYRRTDAEAKLFIDNGAGETNHVPAARLKLISLAPTGTGQVTTVALDASDSSDQDGTIVNYIWRIPDAAVDESPVYSEISGPGMTTQTFDLPKSGTYSIELTVVDDKGASTTTYRRVVVENRKPVAVGSVSASSVVLGVDPFSLTGSTSYDPDGTINTTLSRWVISGKAASGSQAQIELPGLDHSGLVLGDQWAPGVMSISLIVVDNDGVIGVYVTSLDLVGPTPPTTIPTTSDQTVPSTTETPTTIPPTSSPTTSTPENAAPGPVGP